MSGRVRQIASLSNEHVKSLRALAMKKRREEAGLFLVEGARAVIEALDCGVAPRELIYGAAARDERSVAALRARALAAGADAVEVTAEILGKLARKDNPQSVIGVFERRLDPLSSVAAVEGALWVALEGVKDPGNLGTVIRTIDAVGGEGVILVGETCDPFSPEAVRATMGSVFAVKLCRADRSAFVALCRSWPGQIVGTALQAEIDYRDISYREPTLVLMGAEQAGLSVELRGVCGALVKLPMRGRADSLNLAVATGVMLYAIENDRSRRS